MPLPRIVKPTFFFVSAYMQANGMGIALKADFTDLHVQKWVYFHHTNKIAKLFFRCKENK